MSNNQIIAIQFNKLGKQYHFSVPEPMVVQKDTYVIVNTSHGRQIGKVVNASVVNPNNTADIQPIERIANDEDLALREVMYQKEEEAIEIVARHLRESKTMNVKVVSAEYGFESNRLTVFLNYDNDSNFDIKSFLREVGKKFRDTRIEVRQVGPRDMAKSISGLGACGIEKRCCSRFLTEFSSISIKMAKSQDISLTPGEITGMCGRLRCCLIYEHEAYEAARANLPKRKKLVQTPLGEGKVIQVLPMADAVVVDLPERGPVTITRSELESGVMEESKPKAVRQVEPQHFADDVEMVKLESAPKRNTTQPVQQKPGAQPPRHGRRDQQGPDRNLNSGNKPGVTNRTDEKSQNRINRRPSGDRKKHFDRSSDLKKDQAWQTDQPHNSPTGLNDRDKDTTTDRTRKNFRRRR